MNSSAHGPIALDIARPIARQVAEALEAAHDAGIVDRDLEPARLDADVWLLEVH